MSAGPYAQVRAARPQGHVEVRVMAGPPADRGMAVNLNHAEARELHEDLGRLLDEVACGTCTCGGPWSHGDHGICVSCGGANVDLGRSAGCPACHALSRARRVTRHFSDEQIDEISRELGKRAAHLVRPQRSGPFGF